MEKQALRATFPFIEEAEIRQDEPTTFVVSAYMPSDSVKISFSGGMGFGRVNDPLQSTDGVMLVASLDDLMATKLKAILDRAESKDYRDLAAMIASGASLPRALSAFRAMFRAEPRTALMAIGYFEDGDIRSLARVEKATLRAARDRVRRLPDLTLIRGSLAIDTGPCGGDAGVPSRPKP